MNPHQAATSVRCSRRSNCHAARLNSLVSAPTFSLGPMKHLVLRENLYHISGRLDVPILSRTALLLFEGIGAREEPIDMSSVQSAPMLDAPERVSA